MTLREYLRPAYLIQELKTEIKIVGGNVNAIAKQADGRIILGGNFESLKGTRCNAIARFNLDGSIDTTFSPPETKFNNSVSCLYLQSDGRIIVGGIFNQYLGTGRYHIVRLNSDGSIDSSFISEKWNENSGFDDNVNSLAIQQDGKVIVGGDFNRFNGVKRANIARLNTDGTLDHSFNQNLWKENSDINSPNTVYNLLLQPDDKICLHGYLNINTIEGKDEVIRLNTDGSLALYSNSETEKDVYYFRVQEPRYKDYVKEGRFISWSFVMDCFNEDNFITELPERLKRSRQFKACPKCACPAEQLQWINFSTPKYMWLKLAGTGGYMGICENCKLQVGYYETRYN